MTTHIFGIGHLYLAGVRSIMHNGARTIGGTMPIELREKVDQLLSELMAEVDAISEDRHLQKGIARSQLPSSLLAALDQDTLYIVAQFRIENRFSTYIYNPEAAWTPQKVLNSAQWEFGFADPLLIDIPAKLVDEEPLARLEDLKRIAADHIDSEFIRFMSLLSLLRTRPIFGSAPAGSISRSALLLLPPDSGSNMGVGAIKDASEAIGASIIYAEDIRNGRMAVRDMWLAINEARIVIADLTGPDPGVMYGLGIAHTVGRDTIIISPKGSPYLIDLPRTRWIEYEDSDDGKKRLGLELSDMLKVIFEPVELG